MADNPPVSEAARELLGRISSAVERADHAGLLSLAGWLDEAGQVFVTGAGRSGLVARAFAMRLMHAGLRAYIPGETATPGAVAGDLLVAISCTGQSGLTRYFAEKAHRLGARVAALTADPAGPLAKLADKAILIPAEAPNPYDRGTVFEHAAGVSLDALFAVLAERRRLNPQALRSRHANLE